MKNQEEPNEKVSGEIKKEEGEKNSDGTHHTIIPS